jgi:hypothetical protein
MMNNGTFAKAAASIPRNGEKKPVRVRLLGGCERFFHLYALAFPVHFCLVAQIEGALDPARLGAALERVRRRHPALRVCIADDADTGPAFCRIDNPIELHAAQAETAADWSAAVERELGLPFSAAPGPLMRATALWASDGTSIVLTFHHAILDALSGTRIIHDLMRALAGDHLEVLPPRPPLEEMIASVASNRDFIEESVFRDEAAPKIHARVAQASHKLVANIASAEWDRNDTARLIRSCKANGTTVHGAICAAASRHLPASDVNAIRIHCPVDLGRLAGIEASDCGVFIGAGSVEIPTARRKSLWDDARSVVDNLQEARSPPQVAAMLQWIAAALPPTAAKDHAEAFLTSLPPSSAVISNLGVLPLAADYGSLRLKAVWGPAMLTNLPADRQTIGVSTFAGQLRLVHQSYEPIPGLLQRIRETLLASCA